MSIIAFFLCLSFNGPVLLDYTLLTINADQNNLPEVVKEQANIMGQAFVRGDYKVFSHYTYPEIVKMIGGENKMAEALTKITSDMKIKGMMFNNITFGDVSKIVKSGNELQCTVAQHTEIKLPSGRAISTSTLIAISTDSGSNWTFVDTSNKDISMIRNLLPHLSRAIVIPPQQPPVQYNY
ncbi:MAG TPA: hypothetical protein VNS58_00810 [Puia sp.]|nr:hypothetical protein [Puia sp.]